MAFQVLGGGQEQEPLEQIKPAVSLHWVEFVHAWPIFNLVT